MSGGLNFLKYVARHRKALCGSVGMLMGSAVGLKFDEWSSKNKDKIIFLTKEENSKPSQAEIDAHSSGENRSDPVLADGNINWSCSCIETEVVGPCNVEFRELREFMHLNRIKDNISELDDEKREMFDKIMEDYIGCTMDYPVYYRETLLEEERAELEREKQKQLEMEEQIRLDIESRTRRYGQNGKDTVLFLTEDENKIPSVVKIHTRDDLEEYRAPIFPDGSINWACGCIEKDVIGPCNAEFREFRQFVHESKQYKDDMPKDKQRELHRIVGEFLGCARQNPVYYSSLFKAEKGDEETKDEPAVQTEPPVQSDFQ